MNLSRPINKSSKNAKQQLIRPPYAIPNQKALSSSSFETSCTAASSSPSMSCTYSCVNSSFTTRSLHHQSALKRRGAIVFHPSIPQETPVHCSSSLISSSGKKFKRRFATCCSYPETIQAARIVATLVHSIDCSTVKEDSLPPGKNAVIFDQSGRLVPDHDANEHLLQRWFLYYHDMYRLCRSKTHRAIVANSFLEELKSDNFSFYQIKSSSSEEKGMIERYVKLDDESVAHRIRKELGRIESD